MHKYVHVLAGLIHFTVVLPTSQSAYCIGLLGSSVVDGGACLVDRQDEEFGNVDVWRPGGSPDDLLRNVFRNHW